MKATSLIDRLRDTRESATAAKIALRHAENDRADFLTWFNASVDYTALGKNAKARDLALAEMLAKDEKAHKYEVAVRKAKDDLDEADCALSCVLDEKHIANDQTWAILAECYRERTGRQMSGREQAGREIVKEQVETTLADTMGEYRARYSGDVSESEIPF